MIILHHDDLLKPDAIEKHLKFFSEHAELALVGGQEDFIDKNGNITFLRDEKDIEIFKKGEILEFIKQNGSYIPCSSVMFDMFKIREVGFFDDRYLATDELFWSRVLQHFPIAILGSALIYRRIHSAQTEYDDFANKFDKIIEASKAQYQIADYEKDLTRRNTTMLLIKKKLSRNCILIAYKVFQITKDFNLSLSYLKLAFLEYPQIFFSKFFLRFIFNTLFRKVD